jgi:hypothetical protein
MENLIKEVIEQTFISNTKVWFKKKNCYSFGEFDVDVTDPGRMDVCVCVWFCVWVGIEIEIEIEDWFEVEVEPRKVYPVPGKD